MTTTTIPDATAAATDARRTKTARVRALWSSRLLALVSVALLLLLLALIVYPLGSMLVRQLDSAAITSVLDDPLFYTAARNTAILVVVPGVLAIVIGSFFAWANERTDARMGVVSTALPLAPLVLPQIALSIGWIFLADSNAGVLNVLLRNILAHIGIHLTSGPIDITSWYGMIFLYTVVLVPFVHIMISAALRNLDPALEEAARISGASVWRTMRTVSLPAIRPAVGASCFLVLLMGVAQYSIPRTIGVTARIDVLSTYLVDLFQNFPPQEGSAAFVGLLVLVVMLIAWVLERRLTRRQAYSTISGRAQAPSIVQLGPFRWLVRLMVLAYLALASLLPLIALVFVALQPYWTPHPDFGAMTLENFRTYFDDATSVQALTDSGGLGIVGATIGVLVAAVLVSFARTSGGRIFRGVDVVARLPGAIAHIVLAVAFLLALGGSPFYLADTLTILLLAYVVLNMPQAWVAARTAVDQIGQPLLDASSISGASSLRTLVRVNLPLMAGGLAAAWAMLFVVIVGDLNASSILAGANTPVVGSEILSIFDNGTYSQLAALGSIIAVASGVIVTLVLVFSQRLQPGGPAAPHEIKEHQMTADIPKFDELPVIEKLGLRHSWDVFGRDDNIGTINHLTPERVVRAASLVSTGEVFDLTWPIDQPSPPMFGRKPLRHTIYPPARNELDDYLDNFYLQGSTQWDGLRHVRAREFGFYTGVTDEMTPGPGRLGVEHWVEHGIVGRGVLIDVARHQASLGTPLVQTEGRPIEADEIAAAAGAQGAEIRPGDVLCIRLGWPGYYEDLSHDERLALNETMTFPGLSARESMARFLWDSQVAAVTCDNPSFEVSPGDPSVGYLHRRLIPSLGIAIGEFFRFDRLAAACASDGRWDFMFVSVPLHVRGGIGSPANAIAAR